MACAYPAAVFAIVPIDNVVTAVFDALMATVGGKHALRVGLLSSSAGNAISDFTGDYCWNRPLYDLRRQRGLRS